MTVAGVPVRPSVADGKYLIPTRFGAMVQAAKEATGGASTGASASPVLFTYDRWVLTASGAQSKTLTFLPLDGSVHVYLNGIGQDETVDYDLDSQTLTVHSAAGALTDDVLWVRYAYEADSPVFVAESVDGLEDTFDRADGTTLVPDRSDGGTWILPREGSHWTISSNRAIKTTDGTIVFPGGDPSYTTNLRADYGDIEEVIIEADLYAPDPFTSNYLLWAATGDDATGGGFIIQLKQYERFVVLSGPSGTLYTSSFTIPDWEDGGAGVHRIKAQYNKATGALQVWFRGDLLYDDVTDIVTTSFVGINCDSDAGNGFDWIQVTPA